MATSRFRFSPSCAHPNPRPTSHAPTPLLAPLTPLRVPLPLANHSEPKVFEVTVNNTFSGAITQHIPNGLAGIHDSVQATILGHVGSIAEQAIRPGRAAGGSAQSLTLPSHTLKAGFQSFRQELLELLYLVSGGRRGRGRGRGTR